MARTDRSGDPIRVVIADDEADMLMWLRLNLSMDDRIEIVGEASDGKSAVAEAEVQQPDAVVLDLRMPTRGEQALAELSEVAPDAKVVVLTGEPFKEEELLARGAAVVLPKDAPPENIRLLLSALCPRV